MTKYEVIYKIATKNNMYSPTIVGIVLNELETMGLIKFESEREAAIKEAEEYISLEHTDYRLHPDSICLIKRLIALVK